MSRFPREAASRTVLDALASVTPRIRRTSPRARIGIFLLWGIGDAVLTTPFLRALRSAYPQARIEAIGKPWLADLFADEGLFDGFRIFVPPWTKFSGKYRLWSREWRDFARAVRTLSKTHFDLLVSLRPDPRETALVRCLSTTEFAGYAASGGKGWVTVDLGRDVADEPAMYRGELAARAADVLLGAKPDPQPRLTAPEPSDIVAQLAAQGYRGGPVLAVNFGASHPLKRWNSERIAETLQQVQQTPGAYLLIESDDAPRIEGREGVPTLRWRGPIRDLKRVLAAADVLLCADSGVMHIGAAVGCRTVSVFGSGSIPRFTPRGAQHLMYSVEPMPCRPCYNSCIYSSPLCMDRIETGRVAALVDQAIAPLKKGRAEHFLR